MRYLLNNRRHGTYWNSTRDTAFIIEAMADYLRASGEDRPEMTVAIAIDGRPRKQVTITPADLFSFDNGFALDTDLLVLVVWSEVVFGRCSPALMKLFEDSVNAMQRHYLLCDWQGITWEPDPLRENPHDRHLLYARYRERLETLGLPFRTLGGDAQARLRQAVDFAGRSSHARLRAITRADIPDLMRVRASVTENVLRSTVLTEQHYREALECDGHGFVAEQDGEIIGFTLGNGATGNVWALFLDPRHEGHGHGRRLLDALVAWFWARGLDTLWLTTSPRTRAERFYRAAGWQQVAATPGGELRFELHRTGGKP